MANLKASSPQPVAFKYDGKEFWGTFEVDPEGIGFVTVYYRTERSSTQIGNSPARSIAEHLLSEMVRKELGGL